MIHLYHEVKKRALRRQNMTKSTDNTKRPTAYSYIRVSTKRQEIEGSLEAQEEQIEKYCEQNGAGGERRRERRRERAAIRACTLKMVNAMVRSIVNQELIAVTATPTAKV